MFGGWIELDWIELNQVEWRWIHLETIVWETNHLIIRDLFNIVVKDVIVLSVDWNEKSSKKMGELIDLYVIWGRYSLNALNIGL